MISTYRLLFGLSVAVLCVIGRAQAMPCTVGSQVSKFSYTGQEVICTIPQDGWYQIGAYGAQGGSDKGGEPGGMGAAITASVLLGSGTSVYIAVGQAGGYGYFLPGSNYYYGGGGGGGSFVVEVSGVTPTPLVIAGGGGGAGNYYNEYGGDALGIEGTNGINGAGNGGGLDAGQGGKGGNGGTAGSSYNGGGGGAGFRADGGTPTSSGASGGKSFYNGLGGGDATAPGGRGGFGGGGGAGYNGKDNPSGSGGGGGGYSGGGGGGAIFLLGNGGGAGGGTSYVISSAQNVTQGLYRDPGPAGEGLVTIAFEAAPGLIPTPEPPTIALVAAGLLGLGRCRRRPTGARASTGAAR